MYLQLLLPLYLWVANMSYAGDVFFMPMNCNELLPDNSPYVQFFDSVALGMLSKDKSMSKRLLRIKSLREKVAETKEQGRDENPVDVLMRETICFYRKTKDPLKQIPFDDPDFISYLRKSIKTVEAKVEDAIFQLEYKRMQREVFEKKTQKNQALLRAIEKDAIEDATRSFNKISKAAQNKVKQED